MSLEESVWLSDSYNNCSYSSRSLRYSLCSAFSLSIYSCLSVCLYLICCISNYSISIFLDRDLDRSSFTLFTIYLFRLYSRLYVSSFCCNSFYLSYKIFNLNYSCLLIIYCYSFSFIRYLILFIFAIFSLFLSDSRILYSCVSSYRSLNYKYTRIKNKYMFAYVFSNLLSLILFNHQLLYFFS